MKDSALLTLPDYTYSEDIGSGGFIQIRVRGDALSDGTYAVQTKVKGRWEYTARAVHVALRDTYRRGGWVIGTQRPNHHNPFLLDERDTYLTPSGKYGRLY